MAALSGLRALRVIFALSKTNREMKTAKTNAARLLDKAGIEYELIPYHADETDLSAVHVAGELGEDIRQVFKTLVLKGERTGYFVCVIPGGDEVGLKKGGPGRRR